jgi:hypothetical protein
MRATSREFFADISQLNAVKGPQKVHKSAVSRHSSNVNVDENKAIAPVYAAEWRGTLRFAPSAAQKRPLRRR